MHARGCLGDPALVLISGSYYKKTVRNLLCLIECSDLSIQRSEANELVATIAQNQYKLTWGSMFPNDQAEDGFTPSLPPSVMTMVPFKKPPALPAIHSIIPAMSSGAPALVSGMNSLGTEPSEIP